MLIYCCWWEGDIQLSWTSPVLKSGSKSKFRIKGDRPHPCRYEITENIGRVKRDLTAILKSAIYHPSPGPGCGPCRSPICAHKMAASQNNLHAWCWRTANKCDSTLFDILHLSKSGKENTWKEDLTINVDSCCTAWPQQLIQVRSENWKINPIR